MPIWSTGQGRADLSGLSWFSTPPHRERIKDWTRSHTHTQVSTANLPWSTHTYMDTISVLTHMITEPAHIHTTLMQVKAHPYTYTHTHILLAHAPNGNRIRCCTYYRKVVYSAQIAQVTASSLTWRVWKWCLWKRRDKNMFVCGRVPALCMLCNFMSLCECQSLWEIESHFLVYSICNKHFEDVSWINLRPTFNALTSLKGKEVFDVSIK